jgi:hypothetical protein
MSLTRPIVSQINTTDIDSTEFASNAQVDTLQSNVDAFASYSNSTFETGPSFTAGVLFDEPIKLIPSENANSAYATSNIISIATPVNSRDNLLVYLDGLLQHPDTYIVTGTTLQFANVEPLPSEVTVGVRYLQTSNLVVDTATSNSIVGANGMLAWDYESKQLRVYDGSTIGGFFANATQTFSYSFQGSVSGYTSGGTPPLSNVIDKFLFASDGNATDAGDLTQNRSGSSGQSSFISGYTSGGSTAPTSTHVNTIDKFPFATDANAIDVGNLSQSRGDSAGQANEFTGYASGGVTPAESNVIDKFPFSTDSNATDVGDLTLARGPMAGQSSTVSGYTSGDGNPILVSANTIDKFPFAADANATDVGDLTQSRFNRLAGQSSIASGYTSGGGNPGAVNTIDKFPFATDSNASDVGDLTVARSGVAGQSSTISGYTSGGLVIDKFPFATDSNASDVGDLTVSRSRLAGQQT